MSVSVLASFTIASPQITSSVAYGGSVIIVTGIWLAGQMYHFDSNTKKGAIALAGGRFFVLLILLAVAYWLGMWLPAVALGMFIAQIALFGSGMLQLSQPIRSR
ncbi:MAG: hypothetical protein Q9M26_01445 [Mariprofundales bacterium]|nr:hypothetical protein [Mariprofundales bacterium]